MHIVLTIPHDIQLNDKEVVKAVDKVMAHPNCKTTYCYVIQNYSSSNPLRKHRHVHLLALNIGMVRGELGNLQFRRLRPYFNVDRLRQAWKRAIGYNSNKQVNLHVNYCSFFQKGQAIHWLSYMYRYQVWDSFKFLVRGGESGGHRPPVYLDKLDSSKLQALLSQQKKRVTWKGFLSATKRRKTVEQLGEFYTMSDIRRKVREDSRRCPYKDEYGHVCGALLIVIDKISEVGDRVLALANKAYESSMFKPGGDIR